MKYHKDARLSNRRALYDSLADMVNSAAETEEEPTDLILLTEEKTVLPELAELYQQNSDYGCPYVQENCDGRSRATI